MDQIQNLIPVEERSSKQIRKNERYELEALVKDEEDRPVTLPAELRILHQQQLAQFLRQPVLLDVFIRNLKKSSVQPLADLSRSYPAKEVHSAAQAVLDYLAENRGFLTYRFGIDTGLAMKSGLQELSDLANWAAQSNYQLKLTPTHSYQDAAGNTITETGSKLLERR